MLILNAYNCNTGINTENNGRRGHVTGWSIYKMGSVYKYIILEASCSCDYGGCASVNYYAVQTVHHMCHI